MSEDDEMGLAGGFVVGIVIGVTAAGVVTAAVVWNAVSLAYSGVQTAKRLIRSAN